MGSKFLTYIVIATTLIGQAAPAAAQASADLKIDPLVITCERTGGFASKAAIGNAIQSTAATPTPGLGLGGVIAALVIGGIISNKIDDKLNEGKQLAPIRPILDQLDQPALSSQLDTRLAVLLAANIDAHPEWHVEAAAMAVRPTLKFDPEARRLSLQLAIRYGDDAAQAESFEVFSPSVPGEHDDHLRYWTENNLEHFYAAINELSGDAAVLVAQYYHATTPSKPAVAIRYADDVAPYYERGTLLQAAQGHVAYRTIAGVVKSAHGMLDD